MINKEDWEKLMINDWKSCVEVIQKEWNTDYGTCEICKEKDGTETLELTTGGWYDNEELINQISESWFWFIWWQESKRGGYYKFVYSEVMGSDK